MNILFYFKIKFIFIRRNTSASIECRDCSNVCHEKCRPTISCKPCRRIGVSGLSHSQIVVNSTRFETASVIDQL
jgi:hypothetical protein